MARKKGGDEESGGNWMDTYGDMVTLLLTFFITLYSMSTIQEDKWAALVKAFNQNSTTKVDQIILTSDTSGENLPGNHGDGEGLNPNSDSSGEELSDGYAELFELISDYVNRNGMENSVEIHEEADKAGEDSSGSETDPDPGQKNIYIRFKNNVLFMPDKSTLRAESAGTLAFIGDCLKEVEDEILLVVIKGHTAKSATSVVDSRILSAERASTISNFFEDECAMAPETLLPLGLGNLYPIAPNDTEEGRTLNRRVEIVIVGKESKLGQSGELLNVLGADYDAKSADVNELTE